MRTGNRGFLRHYLGDHFRGKLSLAVSFWVNFIVLALALYLAGATLHDLAAADRRYVSAFLAFILLNTVIYAWQVGGVWRATERALQEHVWFFWVRGAQLVVVLSVALILGQFLAFAHLATRKEPPDAGLEPGRGYTLTLSPDAGMVELSGTIGFGITHDMTRLLAGHGSVHSVSLNSPGGLVSEARGLAKLVARHGLATYSAGTCSSACTQVYISGERRFLGPRARLGFHSYRLDSPYSGIFMDPVTEQRNDLTLFRERSVVAGFLDRILATPPDTIWYPTHEELLAAGVVHEIRSPEEARHAPSDP